MGRAPRPVLSDYASLYWRLVRGNRDRHLCPPTTLTLVRGSQTFRSPAGPTHGYYRYVYPDRCAWLAAPDQEFGELLFEAKSGSSKTGGDRGDTVQVDWVEAGALMAAGQYGIKQFRAGGPAAGGLRSPSSPASGRCGRSSTTPRVGD